jgi:hypothetical protein
MSLKIKAIFISLCGLMLMSFQNFSYPPSFEGSGAASMPTASAKTCFIKEDLFLQKHIVSIFATPAAKGLWPETSPYYPGNVFSGRPKQELPEFSSSAKLESLHQLWANRCHFVQYAEDAEHQTASESDCKKMAFVSAGNESLGVRGRQVVFSTYKKANACTIIQARRLLRGDADANLSLVAKRFGLEFLPRQEDMEKYWETKKEKITIASLKGAPLQGEFLVDKCIAPTEGISPAGGISLDYEVSDDRPPGLATSLLGSLGKLAHSQNKKVIVFTNPITSELNSYGIDRSNFRRILSYVDMISINLATGAGKGVEGNPQMGIPSRPDRPAVRTHLESLESILAEIEHTKSGKKPFTQEEQKRIMWGVGLFYTDIDDAKLLYKKLFVDNQYGGVAIQRAFVPQGGACDRTEQHIDKTVQVNQVIACLSFGVCDGSFRK